MQRQLQILISQLCFGVICFLFAIWSMISKQEFAEILCFLANTEMNMVVLRYTSCLMLIVCCDFKLLNRNRCRKVVQILFHLLCNIFDCVCL